MRNGRVFAASTVIAALFVLILGSISHADARAVPAHTATTVVNGWQWPVAEPQIVTRPFVAPETQYSAGHRGIDLAAAIDTEVRAPSDGIVSFAGTVVDRPVLSIEHPGEVITTVEPVIARVVEGERVAAGQVIGIVASGGHCAPGCLHFGVRSHGLYVSPLLYVGIVPRAVLLPMGP